MNSRTPLEEIEYQKLHYHDDKAPAIYAGSTLLIASATIVVVLRLVARRMSSASWQADDFSIVIALVGPPSSVDCARAYATLQVFAFGMFVSIIMGMFAFTRRRRYDTGPDSAHQRPITVWESTLKGLGNPTFHCSSR